MLEQGIEPHIPIFDNSQRADGSFSRADFIYDTARDLYVFLGGKEAGLSQKGYWTTSPRDNEDGMIRYRASKVGFDACAVKPQCYPKQPARKIM